jgi:hypothetical protein
VGRVWLGATPGGGAPRAVAAVHLPAEHRPGPVRGQRDAAAAAAMARLARPLHPQPAQQQAQRDGHAQPASPRPFWRRWRR